MINLGKARRADKDLYNYAAQDFIPIACHYNKETLLTKNGHLMQIIHIHGINAENISQKLVNLREMVRDAIKKNVQNRDFSFWIHTIRRKTNLDDQVPYEKLLSANIHNMWRTKNYWDDKFVNTLYITIIYKQIDLNIKNINSLINSLYTKTIIDIHDKYFDYGIKRLTTVVNKILADLTEYGAEKLAIRSAEDEVFSDPMFLFRRIMHLNEMETPLSDTDLSSILATHHYAVGGDKIEVISGDDKKFAAMLSIKEYQEISGASLDAFLQIPVEMIITEVFYFVERKDVVPAFLEQSYILRVSGDKALGDAKGINKIITEQNIDQNIFCHQQISIAVIGDNLKKLDAQVHNASNKLAEIGIIHVREDINLEQTFWAQLPGNFSFMRRINPTILENTAALTSLHNFPTGSQYNKWGRAVTLLRTEKGTPYFMNFHNKDNQGNTCIYGSFKSGKTTLMNFLISEATKYNPNILYLSNNDNAQIFIHAIEGTWNTKNKNIINPFLLEDNKISRDFLEDFLKIICNHYTIALLEQEIAFIKDMINFIFSLPKEKRIFSSIIEAMNFENEGGRLIKPKLQIFAKGSKYFEVFENDSSIFGQDEIRGYNLSYFTDGYFEQKFYPQEKKLLDQYKIDMKIHSSVRWGVIYSLTHFLSQSSDHPKILAIDNIGSLCRQDQFQELLKTVFAKMAQNNGVVISNFNLNSYDNIENQMWGQLFNLSDTNIVMPANVTFDKIEEVLNLTKEEVSKLKNLSSTSRLFLIKQNNQSIAAELSLGGFVGILKILSSKENDRKIYQKIIAQNSNEVDKWLQPLYEAFETNLELDNIEDTIKG